MLQLPMMSVADVVAYDVCVCVSRYPRISFRRREQNIGRKRVGIK